MALSLEESKYALSKILEVLCSEWQEGIDYDALKRDADRHNDRIRELEAAQPSVKPTCLNCGRPLLNHPTSTCPIQANG